MAEAFKCDRCERFNEGKPDTRIHWTDRLTEDGKNDHLCDECRRSFFMWRTALRDRKKYVDQNGTPLDLGTG